LLYDACVAIEQSNTATYERIVVMLLSRPRTSEVLSQRLDRQVYGAWERGWQPADLLRYCHRRLGNAHADLLTDLMGIERTEYATATVSEAWDAQLYAAGVRMWWPAREEYWAVKAAAIGTTWAALLRLGIDLLDLLVTLPAIGLIGPLPGEGRRGSLGPGMASESADLRMRDKVRALLAKAESTEYAEEAEALTAKAQELMVRHSIDYALLAATSGANDAPAAIRVGLDAPYEDAKALLLTRIGEANACRSAWSKDCGFVTVIGYAADLASVEMLYTSLLVQATTAMLNHGKDRQSRTASFRRSFLYAFALRIGERLLTVADRVGKAAAQEGKGALVPVLAAKRDSVDAATEELLGHLQVRPIGPTNYAGWTSGRAAADLARLGTQGQLGR
jgi:hypothetical protein